MRSSGTATQTPSLLGDVLPSDIGTGVWCLHHEARICRFRMCFCSSWQHTRTTCTLCSSSLACSVLDSAKQAAAQCNPTPHGHITQKAQKNIMRVLCSQLSVRNRPPAALPMSGTAVQADMRRQAVCPEPPLQHPHPGFPRASNAIRARAPSQGFTLTLLRCSRVRLPNTRRMFVWAASPLSVHSHGYGQHRTASSEVSCIPQDAILRRAMLHAPLPLSSTHTGTPSGRAASDAVSHAGMKRVVALPEAFATPADSKALTQDWAGEAAPQSEVLSLIHI